MKAWKTVEREASGLAGEAEGPLGGEAATTPFRGVCLWGAQDLTGVRALQEEGVVGTRTGLGAAEVQLGNCPALGTEASPGREATSPSPRPCSRAWLCGTPSPTLSPPGLASSGNTCPAEAADGQ